MALQLSYTSADGVVHSVAYAKVTKVAPILPAAGSDAFEYCIELWHSATERNADPPKSIVGSQRGIVSGADYTTYFQDSVLKTVDKSPTSQAYVYLKAHVPVSGMFGTEIDFRTASDV